MEPKGIGKAAVIAFAIPFLVAGFYIIAGPKFHEPGTPKAIVFSAGKNAGRAAKESPRARPSETEVRKMASEAIDNVRFKKRMTVDDYRELQEVFIEGFRAGWR